MTDKRVFILSHPMARANAVHAVQTANDGLCVTIRELNRTLDQNAAQWPILEAFSDQLQWPVNGELVKMSAEEWKDVLTAAFERENARLAMGIDGGVVMLGKRTSQYGKKKFSEWLEFLHAVAAMRGVAVSRDEVAA
jgi:NinB protein